VLAALVAVALLAGCGGGSSSSSSTAAGEPSTAPAGGAATKSAYIDEADGICQANREQTAPLKEEIETIESSAEPESEANLQRLGSILRQADKIAVGEYEELRELAMPAEDEATLDAMYAQAEEGEAFSAEGAEALEAGELTKFGEIETRADKVNRAAHTAATGYGFTVCGKAE
jgi:hypothetical protein